MYIALTVAKFGPRVVFMNRVKLTAHIYSASIVEALG